MILGWETIILVLQLIVKVRSIYRSIRSLTTGHPASKKSSDTSKRGCRNDATRRDRLHGFLRSIWYLAESIKCSTEKVRLLAWNWDFWRDESIRWLTQISADLNFGQRQEISAVPRSKTVLNICQTFSCKML